MATNERFMAVPPQAVWDVLADPGGYGYWVVGSKLIRDADAGAGPRPARASTTRSASGPLKLSDHTVALEAEPPRRFKLRAKGRPVGTATVTLEMTPRDGGTLVRITENPDGVFALMTLNPAVHVLTKLRNAESLMRLEELALQAAR